MSTPQFKVTWLKVATLALSLSIASAWAQWQWTDASGRKVFSDTAPPSSVPERDILRRPGEPHKLTTSPAPPEATGKTDMLGEPVPHPAEHKKLAELETKKKLAEEAETARKKAEEQKTAQAKADNCQRAQRSLATLNTESRLVTINAQGERVFMDETVRNTEKARLQQILQQNCRP